MYFVWFCVCVCCVLCFDVVCVFFVLVLIGVGVVLSSLFV